MQSAERVLPIAVISDALHILRAATAKDHIT